MVAKWHKYQRGCLFIPMTSAAEKTCLSLYYAKNTFRARSVAQATYYRKQNTVVLYIGWSEKQNSFEFWFS